MDYGVEADCMFIGATQLGSYVSHACLRSDCVMSSNCVACLIQLECFLSTYHVWRVCCNCMNGFWPSRGENDYIYWCMSRFTVKNIPKYASSEFYLDNVLPRAKQNKLVCLKPFVDRLGYSFLSLLDPQSVVRSTIDTFS